MVAIMLMLTLAALLLIYAWQPCGFIHSNVVFQPHTFHMVKGGSSAHKLNNNS